MPIKKGHFHHTETPRVMARIAKLLRRFLDFRIVVCLFSFFSTSPALALDEFFEIYNAPQALAMGNAYTADATGYAALFHNPAGIAKGFAKGWEVTPVAFDAILGAGFCGTAMAGKSFGMNRLLDDIQRTPNTYNYMRGNFIPAISRRNFALAALGTYEFAAISDGTNLDVQGGTDLGVYMGTATNFAANMLKFGITGKAILRNQLKGVFAHSAFTGADPTSPLMKEGLGVGADFGMLLTLPMSWLPTLGFTWKDILSTRFITPTRILNPLATGALPDSIPQSFNVAVSAHPILWRGARATFSAEFRHIERTDLSLLKRLHFGFEFVTRKKVFIWLGMNQLYPTGGVGMRVPGGNLEIGTYAQDVGVGAARADDRRFYLRYTIGF